MLCFVPPAATIAGIATRRLSTGMTVDSARRLVRGKGGSWKGRTFIPAAR
jgi:hypothetical protein